MTSQRPVAAQAEGQTIVTLGRTSRRAGPKACSRSTRWPAATTAVRDGADRAGRDEILPGWTAARGLDSGDPVASASHPVVRAEIEAAVEAANSRLARVSRDEAEISALYPG